MDLLQIIEDFLKSLSLGFFIGVLLKTNFSRERRSLKQKKHYLRMFLYEKFNIQKETVLKYSSAFRCLLTNEIMEVPLVNIDGQSIESTAIVNYLKNNDTFPKTMIKADIKDFYENRMMKDFLEYNRQTNNKFFKELQ